MKLNLERYILAHILILGIFILAELLVPAGYGIEKLLILGYFMVASMFSHDIISLGK